MNISEHTDNFIQEMNLSQLKQGDFFVFIPDQIIYYLRSSVDGVEFNTNSYTKYEVLKKNEKSVKVKPIDGRVEYTFKFSGKLNNETIICKDVKIKTYEQ